jgi:HipA-like protein
LIDTLSETDKLRASSFAERNGLLAELARFNALRAGSETFVPGATRTYESLDLYFYHWHVGTLDSLPAREFRFAYHDGWGIPLPGLPLQHSRASYEGPGLPAFFDNLLPEGWAESRLQAVHKIAREDTFALLRTTQKYLSNFTLRSREFEESRLVLDYLDVTLADFNQTDDPLPVDEQIGLDPDSRKLWLELRRRGATRLSGIQPKLPVHLKNSNRNLQVEIGHVGNTSTHILKLPSPEFPQLVDNEWTTMELARRVGLRVPLVRRVQFSSDSELKSPGLLIERFDLPISLVSPREVPVLEEAAVLLGVPREDKSFARSHGPVCRSHHFLVDRGQWRSSRKEHWRPALDRAGTAWQSSTPDENLLFTPLRSREHEARDTRRFVCPAGQWQAEQPAGE